MKDNSSKDQRLLEAFNEIDPRFIAEVADELKIEPEPKPVRVKRTPRRSMKYVAVLAACILLIVVAIPVAAELIRGFSSIPSGVQTGETTPLTSPESEEVPEVKYDEYILTEDDLVSINDAWYKRFGRKFADTVEFAMKRTKTDGHYFGKYGDTVVIWLSSTADEACIFTLSGRKFSFSTGKVWFFHNARAYNQNEIAEIDVLTGAQLDALYSYYSDVFLNFEESVQKYTYPLFVPDLEPLSQEEMGQINETYASWRYDAEYEWYLILHGEEPTFDPALADEYARTTLGDESRRFFTRGSHANFQYYGKFGDCVVLAIEMNDNALITHDIAGYGFELDGEGYLLVYRDGAIHTLYNEYKEGILTKEQIASVHERHMAYINYITAGDDPEPSPELLKLGILGNSQKFTEDIQREIVWAYIEGAEEMMKYTYCVRCYGVFGKTYAVMIDGPWGYPPKPRTLEVGKYTFTFPSDQKMYIYKGGTFYTLLEAYQKGIINDRNVQGILYDKYLTNP